jgi:hypothetical protein
MGLTLLVYGWMGIHGTGSHSLSLLFRCSAHVVVCVHMRTCVRARCATTSQPAPLCFSFRFAVVWDPSSGRPSPLCSTTFFFSLLTSFFVVL